MKDVNKYEFINFVELKVAGKLTGGARLFLLTTEKILGRRKNCDLK
jgi:hypothetical protein